MNIFIQKLCNVQPVLISAKTKSQNSKVKSQPEQPTTTASGLFSSDEDGGLFSTTTVKTHGQYYLLHPHFTS